MYLTKEDYDRLNFHRVPIERSARIGSQSDTAPWYVMAEIKQQRTGQSSNGMCGACVIELYREMWIMMLEYERINASNE